MPTDSHIEAFGQPATHCSNCYAGIGAFANNYLYQTDSASSLSLDPWALAAPSSGFINGDGNHRDVDSFVTSPNHNAHPNQALAGTLDVTVIRDQHIPIWSPNLSPSNRGFQQQAVGTPNNGWNNEWNLDVSVAPPTWDPASHGFAQSLSHVTSGFGQCFITTLNSADYPPVYSNAIGNGQPDPTLQLPGFGVYNDFVDMPNSFANYTSFTQWDESTAIDPQETMASFNQLPLPTTTGMPAALALPTHATSMFTAPAVPRPIARRVVPRRSNVNTNAHTCDSAGCGKIFTRPGDLARHRQQHGVPQHPCLIHGCNRRRSRAFYRADKLRDHQRKKHGIAI
ncbi:hypothetical protein BKA61DRAFT_739664 [Leptodontidium sp. MPI-SDFR-AT-0119]|nr:hypothetical protein BKA61DRAFT_739664 [Leptodontidium sp. MPI-SDFR-AT-0119]